MIWAQDRGGAIGVDGAMPWHLPEDLAHFKRMTHGYAVVHGRRSYEALPAHFRPLPGRRNVVLTRSQAYRAPGAEVVHSLAEAGRLLAGEPVWIVGGGQVYAEALACADVLVVTRVDIDVEGDAHAPAIDPGQWRVVQETPVLHSAAGVQFRIQEYRRKARADR